MAVVTTVYPTIFTNLYSSPPKLVDEQLFGGVTRRQRGTFEVTSGNSIASIYPMAVLPSNATIDNITIFCDAITSAAGDIGLYQTVANGSAVVDVDCYASAVSIATAITLGTNVRFEAGAAGGDVASMENQVWQDLALSADPHRDYILALTLTAAATATGTFSYHVTYTTPN